MIRRKTTSVDSGFAAGPLNFFAIYCIDSYKMQPAHAPRREKYCNNLYNGLAEAASESRMPCPPVRSNT
jgi:hypothetical protein